jgi:hypothetical protein
MRLSVISHISCSMVSFGAHVVTSRVMRSATDWSSALTQARPGCGRRRAREDPVDAVTVGGHDERADAPLVQQSDRPLHGGVGRDGRHIVALAARMLCTYIRNLPGARPHASSTESMTERRARS